MVKISIITPTYNRGDVIGRALDSVQSQTHTDAEHIVVDDGSTDGTQNLFEGYNDDRVPVRFERLGENKGANVARNRGLDIATGEIVTFLDSDDEYLPKRLEILCGALAGDEYVAATHRATIVDQDGVSRPSTSPTGEITLDALRSGNPVGTLSSTAFKREVVEDVGGFDPTFPASQDYDLYIRVLEQGAMIGLSDTLLRYYRRDDAISANPDRKAKAQKLLWGKHGDKLSSDLRARQAYTLGHQYAVTGQMRKAQRSFGRSFRGQPNPLTAYHYALAALGQRPFSFGMQIKRRGFNLIRSLGVF